MLHEDGLTLSQPLGNTNILVKAPGASHVAVLNHKGIKTDSRGYAVIPYATPYRVNQVALDVTTVGNDVELENAIANKIPTDGALVRATLTTRQGAKAMFIVRHAKDVLPFGTLVSSEDDKASGIVGDGGSVYLTGLSAQGTLHAVWGRDSAQRCTIRYALNPQNYHARTGLYSRGGHMSVTVRFLPPDPADGHHRPARGYDVLVSVTGNVIGNTCIVSEDSKEQNVPLGTLGVKQFSEAGAVSNIKTPFTLTLEACGPTFAGVKIRFSGTPDDENPQLLKVADGGATGVAVQILDKDSVLIPLDTQTAAYGAAGDDSVKMTFYARLAATGAPVNAGDVSAVATSDDGVSIMRLLFLALFFMSSQALALSLGHRISPFRQRPCHGPARQTPSCLGKTIGSEWSATASVSEVFWCGLGIYLLQRDAGAEQQYNRHRHHGYS